MRKPAILPVLFALLLLAIGCGVDSNLRQSKGPTDLSISPVNAKIALGKSITLTVTAVNTAILWPTSVAGSYQLNSNTAIYTPPSVEGTYEFTVTAAANSAKKATAIITVKKPEILIFPKTAILRQGMDLRFLADVQPEQVAATWNVSGDCGMITPEGRFHALNAGNCSVAASATGTDGQKISGEAEITVLAGLVNTGVSNVVDLAESLNLPADEFTQCYNGESVDAVNSSINEGSTVFGINGTPGNVLLDRETGAYKRVFGASPVDTFENALAGLWSSGGSLPTITASKVEEVLTGAHFYGNPEARTVIIVYADLLCPYCKRHYNDQTIETIAANHPGEVAMVFKNFPLTIHPTASLGARGLYCAGKIGGDDIYYSYLAQAIQAYGFTD